MIEMNERDCMFFFGVGVLEPGYMEHCQKVSSVLNVRVQFHQQFFFSLMSVSPVKGI